MMMIINVKYALYCYGDASVFTEAIDLSSNENWATQPRCIANIIYRTCSGNVLNALILQNTDNL